MKSSAICKNENTVWICFNYINTTIKLSLFLFGELFKDEYDT